MLITVVQAILVMNHGEDAKAIDVLQAGEPYDNPRPSSAPRLAESRRPRVMANGRCRMQVVLVPDRTPRGRAGPLAAGALEHGLYSAEARAEQKGARELLTQSRELLKQMQAG